MLKPSEMGVTNKNRKIYEHEALVRKKLTFYSKGQGIKSVVANICLQIIDTPSGGQVDITGLKHPYFGDINNYFAEVMGPIWSSRGLIPGINKNSICFFSSSDTEALYDFIVYKNEKNPILVSNKQKSSSTNTVKPAQILNLLQDSQPLLKKWRDTKYYQIFKLLDENNIVSGPINVITKVYFKELKKSHDYIEKEDLYKTISLLTGNNIVITANDLPKNIVRLLKEDNTTNIYFSERKYKEATGVMINFIFEKFLSDMSKQDDNFHELFCDVTEKNVLFMKFIMKEKKIKDLKTKENKSVGVIEYEISDPRKSDKKAFLRPKQGAGGRPQDKLGLQP